MLQWHQCSGAVVSKIMRCQSFGAICIRVSSKEIQWFFACRMTVLNCYFCLPRVRKFTRVTETLKSKQLFSGHNSIWIYCQYMLVIKSHIQMKMKKKYVKFYSVWQPLKPCVRFATHNPEPPAKAVLVRERMLYHTL